MAKRKLLFIGLLYCISVAGMGQANLDGKKEITKPDTLVNPHLAVYKKARALGDNSTAIHSLHYLLATEPKAANYADTLAYLYLDAGAYPQAYRLAESILKQNSNDNLALEIKGLCAIQLQQPVVGLESYSTLYDRTAQVSYGFRKLQLQYGLRRLGETVATAEQLLTKLPAQDKTEIAVEKADNKSSQKVAMKAGILYLQGLSLEALKEKDKAVTALQAALQINPDYEMARQKLNDLLAATKVKPAKSKG
jgi:tetratricopeptide (TPR) repeat protein